MDDDWTGALCACYDRLKWVAPLVEAITPNTPSQVRITRPKGVDLDLFQTIRTNVQRQGVHAAPRDGDPGCMVITSVVTNCDLAWTIGAAIGDSIAPCRVNRHDAISPPMAIAELAEAITVLAHHTGAVHSADSVVSHISACADVDDRDDCRFVRQFGERLDDLWNALLSLADDLTPEGCTFGYDDQRDCYEWAPDVVRIAAAIRQRIGSGHSIAAEAACEARA